MQQAAKVGAGVWGSGLLYFPAPELIMTHPYHQEEVEAGLFCEIL